MSLGGSSPRCEVLIRKKGNVSGRQLIVVVELKSLLAQVRNCEAATYYLVAAGPTNLVVPAPKG